MSARRTRTLVLTGVMATVAVLWVAMIRNHPVDAGLSTLPLALPPPAATVAGDGIELLAEDLQILGSVAEPVAAAPEAAGKPATKAREQSPAVVAVTTAPTTVRKVIVGKGKRVVRHVPVVPAPIQQQEATPATRTARFDMSQNGKRMTADEFDAWMKAQGIRVATGAVKPATVPTAAGTPPVAPVPSVVPPALPAAASPGAACTPQTDKAC